MLSTSGVFCVRHDLLVIRCDEVPVRIADNLLSHAAPLTPHCTKGSHAKPELPFKRVYLKCDVLIYLENRDYHAKSI